MADPVPPPVPNKYQGIIIAVLTAIAAFLAGLHTGPTPLPQPTPPPIVINDDHTTPSPEPQPSPSPSAVITITDTTGKEVTVAGLNQQLIISAAKAVRDSNPTALVLTVDPPVQQFATEHELIITTPPVHTILRIQEIVALGGKISVNTVTLVCGNQEPRPPTPIPDPEPAPNPEPVPPKPVPVPAKRQLIVETVENPLQRAPSTATVLESFVSWTAFQEAGNCWINYSVESNEAKGKAAKAALDTANITILPGIVIRDKSTRLVLYAGRLPTTVEEKITLISQYYGGSL